MTASYLRAQDTEHIRKIGRVNGSNAELNTEARYEHLNNLWPDLILHDIKAADHQFPGRLCRNHRGMGPKGVEISFDVFYKPVPICVIIRFIGEGSYQSGKPTLSVSVDGELPSLYIADDSGFRPGSQITRYQWTEIRHIVGKPLSTGLHTLSVFQQDGACLEFDFISIDKYHPDKHDPARLKNEPTYGRKSKSATRDVSSVAAKGDVIYVGGEDGTILKSEDSGNSWIEISRFGSPVRALLLNSNQPERIHAGLWNTSIYISDDGGATWSHLKSFTDMGFDDLEIFGKNELICLVDGILISSIFKSRDSGKKWETMKENRQDNVKRENRISLNCLAIRPTNPDIWYAGMLKGNNTTKGNAIYKSTDGGMTYSPISNHTFPDNHSIREIVIDPINPEIVLAATEGNGVLASGDGGISWILSNNGLHSLSVYDITFDSSNDNVLYVGCRYFSGREGGLFKSVDRGRNWKKIAF